MEMDELEPTGYFSEFSWVSNESDEEDTVVAVDGADIFNAPLREPLLATDMPALPVLEQQGVTTA
jgi:hypothetical protein